MAQPFEAELEELVAKFARQLKDEVTDLILRRLGIERAAPRPLAGPKVSAPKSARAPVASKRARGVGARPAKAVAAEGAGGGAGGGANKKRSRATTEERAQTLTAIERIVAASEGLSAGEVERKVGLSSAVVAGALKALKAQKRIYMGGTKRFARYAMTQSAADKASRESRGGRG